MEEHNLFLLKFSEAFIRDYSGRSEKGGERQCVSERVRRTCCVTYAALQTSQIILSCICIMCIGMATHLDRESTCTVIETNMVILFGAYLAYFSLTNQSREVTCDFDYASGDGDDYGDWNYDDRDFLKLLLLLLSLYYLIITVHPIPGCNRDITFKD